MRMGSGEKARRAEPREHEGVDTYTRHVSDAGPWSWTSMGGIPPAPSPQPWFLLSLDAYPPTLV